jgi:hypothetical protein
VVPNPSDNSHRPPTPLSSSRWHATSLPPQVRPLLTPPPTSPQPRRLRRVDKCLPPPSSILQPQLSTVKPLPPPPYHLRLPTYHSRTTTPVPSHPPSITDATSPAATTDATSPAATSATRPISYLRRIIQQVHSLIRCRRRQRHELFMLDPTVTLTSFLPVARLPNRRHRILVESNDGCRFPDDDYVVPSTRGSNRLHITKTSPHHQQIVRGMPPN